MTADLMLRNTKMMKNLMTFPVKRKVKKNKLVLNNASKM